ncbi:class III lanthionine synthetase LanKC [Luteibacter sp. CQ10]|uniref:class III lanthionine synthetase LanKC n=1 Tax=Luteibacter sp. CQ10 TaxID=2805821 RepID=UPI0034A4316F
MDLLPYTGVDRDFFDTHGSRPIDEGDFVDAVRRIVRRHDSHKQRCRSWNLERSGIWVQCMPSDAALPMQGWKIHVSSVVATARIVLSIAAAVLVENGVAFKFAADAAMLGHVNGKRWPRGGSGKFMTIYPRDTDQFRRVLEDLHASLSGYVGPYVLTDRRYRDSHVLYYRYGGIRGEPSIGIDGRAQWMLVRPDGSREIDSRQPGFRLPEWLRDPFPSDGEGTAGPVSIGGGRFRMHRALSFSSAGGIYLADDLDEGRRVIVKEARPYIGGADAATGTLRKEFRLLRLLAPMGVAPRPVAHFREWEHTFLVEEYLEGETLRRWLGRRYPWLKTRATRADVAVFLGDLCKVFTNLATVIDRVHGIGVSLGDLSFHNCIVDGEGGVRIIDLEACAEDGLDVSPDLLTPGFAPAVPRRRDHAAACADDHYAFGANLLAAMMPVNAMLPLDRGAALRFTSRMVRDMGYPAEIADAIVGLLADDPKRRPRPLDAMARIRGAVEHLDGGNPPVPHRGMPHPLACDPSAELFRFIEDRAAHARPDRYVPAGAEIFQTHPWGVAHGASGVLHAFLRGRRTPPSGLVDYVLDGTRSSRSRGVDLANGDSGIAWVLYDAGQGDTATALLRRSSDTPIEWSAHGLHAGQSGWGLARLKAWYETADGVFLREAIMAGDALLAAAVDDDHGLHWPENDAKPVGLAHGASGVALFLLHLHLVTGETRFIVGARRALAYDFAQRCLNVDGDPTWPLQVGHGTVTPYLRHGTAGVVAVAARMLAATGDPGYRDMVMAAEADLFRPHAVCPGRQDGLAGIGETLLDLAAYLPDRAAIYRREAHRVASGIEPFLVRRQGGLAVPGRELVRLSCDFATGSAGVAAFFDRLWRGGAASFMLDEHMPSVAHASTEAA